MFWFWTCVESNHFQLCSWICQLLFLLLAPALSKCGNVLSRIALVCLQQHLNVLDKHFVSSSHSMCCCLCHPLVSSSLIFSRRLSWTSDTRIRRPASKSQRLDLVFMHICCVFSGLGDDNQRAEMILLHSDGWSYLCTCSTCLCAFGYFCFMFPRSSWSALLSRASSSAGGSPSTSCSSRATLQGGCHCGASRTLLQCSQCRPLAVRHGHGH